jgi:glycosyltransferase involved in cell wall biosynthesis
MLKDKLTIFIPTYNRWAMLEKTLTGTLASNVAGVKVVILDNHSAPEGRAAVERVIADYSDRQVQIIKNPVNIGGDGNILRCFELCETPYVMVLGDDDFLEPDFLKKIEAFLLSDSDYGFISFQVPREYASAQTQDKVFDSPYDLLNESGNWAELLFISTNVYRKDLVMMGYEQAQRYQLTCSTQLIAVLKGWEALKKVAHKNRYKFVLAHEPVVASSGHGRDHRSYGVMVVLKGLSIVRSVFESEPQASVVRKAIRGAARYVFKPRVLVKEYWRYTLEFGFVQAWRQLCNARYDLTYLVGLKSLWYRPYLHLSILLAGAWRFILKR